MTASSSSPETVGSYATTALATRLVRKSTLDSYLQTLRLLGLWHLPMEALTLQSVHTRLLEVTNTNTRRKYTVALRSVFRDLPWAKELKIPKASPRVYDLPDEDTLRFALMLTPYEIQGLLMMYAGLRCGEACAIGPNDVRGNILKVHKQRYKDGTLVQAKTVGEVVIPRWLADRVRNMEQRIITPGAVRESFRRNGKKVGIDLSPHLFRHWYATMMVNKRINPEIARQQLRHADLKTTLGFYAQVKKSDIEDVVTDLFGD